MSGLIFREPQGYAQPGKRVRRTRKHSPDPLLRHCLECDEFRPLEDFCRVNKQGRLDSWCRACRLVRTRAWAAEPDNKEAVVAQRAAKRRVDREMVLAHYGGACACCGEDTHEFLAIDHVNGGGTAHRKLIGKEGGAFVTWLIQQGFPDGYRVLCHNCNTARGLYGACPHELSLLTSLA